MGIGKRIKIRREQLGLTQAELASLLKITPSAVTNYENDTSHPKEKVLYKLFDVLQCDANYLFKDEIKDFLSNPQRQRLIDNYDGLNADGQTKLVDYSDDLVNSGNYKSTPKTSAAPDDLVDIKIAAKGGGVEGRQITREQAEKVKKMLDEIELKDHTGL